MTVTNLDPPPENPADVDWVYVGRLVGLLAGPITRRPTEAEARAAVRGENGITIAQLAQRVRIAAATAQRMVRGHR